MKELKVNVSSYRSEINSKQRWLRIIWVVIWQVFARPLPRTFLNGWKIFLLRLFGASVHNTAVIYSSVKIYMPWNLEMAEFSCLGPEVDCYNVAKITIGKHSTVSQKSYLCTASHNINVSNMPLIHSDIKICDQSWIGADVFIGMGVTIGEGAVVGARSSVFKDVIEWTVVGGNPAKFLKNRILNNA